jgi:hypothetical protein
MIKLNASPEMRDGVTLSNGVSKLGARQEMIKAAVERAKEGVSAVA